MALAESAPQTELSFIHNGELPKGINIESELHEAMIDQGFSGALEYWQKDAEVGQTQAFSRDYYLKKLDAVDAILLKKGVDVDPEDSRLTHEFAEWAFDIYEGKRDLKRQSGSFAFTAATRLQRVPQGTFEPVDYRRETIGCYPIFKYLDGSSAQLAMVGLPPFILDYYGQDKRGGGGMMVFSPLFLNVVGDSGSLTEGIETAKRIAQETSWLAKERADIKMLSLAALLPKVTNWGEFFQYPGIDTTTGHGGTTWLIGETVERAINEGRVDAKLANKIGVLGVGGIGFAAADLILSNNPDVQVAINDHNSGRQEKISRKLKDAYGDARVVDAANAEEVLRFGGVTVSAITSPIDLFKETQLKPGDLEGRVYADDSQPAAIDAAQVEALGGVHTGVIAEDRTEEGIISGTRFNYGGMGPKELNHAYGCCMEGGALFYSGELDKRIKTAVTGDMAREIGKICAEMGFGAAPLQTLKEDGANYV